MKLPIAGVEFFFILSVLSAVDPAVPHQGDPDQDSRDDPGNEQLGRRAVGRGGINDIRNAGRNDDPQAPGHSHNGGGKDLFISHGYQKRNGHGPYSRNRCRRRTGNGCIEHAGSHYRTGEPGRLVADEIPEEIEQLLGNPALGHNHPGNHEHGGSQQGETVEAGEHSPGYITDAKSKLAVQQIGNRGQQREYPAYRESDEKQCSQQYKKESNVHSSPAPFPFCISFPLSPSRVAFPWRTLTISCAYRKIPSRMPKAMAR